MKNNINSFEVFKQFSSVNTNISANENNSQNSANVSNLPVVEIKDKFDLNDSNNKDIPVENNLKTSKPTAEKKLKSKMIGGDQLTKLKVGINNIAKLPEYAYRGLKGDPNANFYEYLSLGKIPYYLGGPLLVSVFAFGITRNDSQARASAVKRTKQIAAGVGLYYIGAELAKKLIDIPVKIFRGVDLNQPYENVVDCRAVSKTGFSPKKIEYHKVPESVDFTRWDLMRGDETKDNGKAINEQFDKIAKKFGIDKNVPNSDATLKGSIKKLIISSTACKYMLTAPLVALGVSLASQEAWGNIGVGLKQNLKNLFNSKSQLNIKQRANIAGEILNGNLISPMKKSFVDLWKNNKIGKALIITSAIAPILANIRILQLTSEKHNKFVDTSEFISGSKKT